MTCVVLSNMSKRRIFKNTVTPIGGDNCGILKMNNNKLLKIVNVIYGYFINFEKIFYNVKVIRIPFNFNINLSNIS